MGRHRSKRTQFAISNRLPFAAAPALLGVAAAITLSASMTASPALASTMTPHIASAGQSWRVANAQLLAAIHPIARKPASAHKTARRYTVRPGDTLITIAKKVYHDPGAWPVLYWANRDKIRWADTLDAGEVLAVPVKPARIPAAPKQLGPAPSLRPSRPARISRTRGSPRRPRLPQPQQAASTYTGSSSFQECVIASESGGNSQVMNSSGHYGLYQFSASTWDEYGGEPGRLR